MNRTLKISLLLAGFLAAQAHAKDVISYDAPAAFPEGIAYNAKTNQFLVSSMHLGTVGAVSRDGKYGAFINDDALISSVGMTVDAKRNRLLVCVTDVGVSVHSTDTTKGVTARLVIFDLETKKRTAVADLGALAPGGHFANDLAVDDQGNAYVTDSFSPIIYKVDLAGKASILLQDDAFKGEGFNLNGIVFHPRGYLLAVKSSTGEIFKVSLSTPAVVAKVAVKEAFPGADGILLDEEGNLVLVQNAAGKVVKLKSLDGWKTAAVVAVDAGPYAFPTTMVRVGKKVYVNNTRLSELFDPKAPKDRSKFSIEEVDFKPAK